jgi:hypothetical protein
MFMGAKARKAYPQPFWGIVKKAIFAIHFCNNHMLPEAPFYCKIHVFALMGDFG